MTPTADTRAAPSALALAWALKDLCYQAWGSDPPRAARAAEVLQALHAARGCVVPGDEADEIAGLAHWTAGITELNRGRMAEAVLAFDTAAAALRRAGRPDPAAQTQVPKIMALSMRGLHDEAAACAEAAQRELLALGNVRAAARVSQNLGNLLGRRDDYAAAARHFREAAVLFARLGEHAHSVSADIGLARAWAALGDFDEALRVVARARMRAGKQGLKLQLALADEAGAEVELARGRYQPALAAFESARRIYDSLGVPHYLAIAEKHLASVYLELRLLPEALALFDTAVAQFRALGLPDEQAAALAQRGRVLALLQRSPSAGTVGGAGAAGAAEAAEVAFAEAAQVFAAQANGVGSASVALARAELALARGDTVAALASADAAAQGYGQAAQADGQARAAVLRAEALLQGGAVPAAQALFTATLATARERQQLQVQVRCLTGQGLAALALGDTAAARAAFEAAIEGFEDQRRALPGDELRRAFITDHLRPYQELLRLALQGGDAAQSLLALDRFRARSLSERVDDDSPGQRPAAAPEDAALRDRLNWLVRRVQRLQDEGESSVALSSELLRTERELMERARRQRLAVPLAGAAPAASDFSDFSLAALQAALGDGDALVEYGALDGTGGRDGGHGAELFACVVTRHGVTLHRALATLPQAHAAIAAARFQIEALRSGAAALERHLPMLTARAQTRLQQLHALLWAPLGGALAGCRRVIVVPHAQLGSLPFAALSDATAVAGSAAAQPLGEQLQLALAPSARLALRGLLRPPVAARRVLALGESSRLPHAAREATAVAALFEVARCYVGAGATLAALRAHAAEADVLHLACHAQFRSDNPRFSALHLADGPLTVDDAETLALQPCTVVLSACETALAESGQGDEHVGLVRAFLVAGASRVVASLWPVDDAVTAGFMAVFYGALRAGQAPAAALACAQSVTRQAHPHPCFWGAFALYGAW